MAKTAKQRAKSSGAGRLFDEHAVFLLRVVERLTGTRADAEDVVQQVFLVAHQKGPELQDPDDARGWLYRVAINVLRHHRRSYARRRALTDALAQQPRVEAPTPDDEARRRQRAAIVRACVATLRLEEREVFVLYELEELSGRAVASMIGVSQGTVWNRLAKAREHFERALSAALQEHMP